MKKLICLLLLTTLFACDNIEEKLLPTFQVSIPPIRLRVPPLATVADKEIPVGALKSPINLDSAIRANTAGTFGADAVRIIRVKDIMIKSSNATEANNLSHFESARIRIFSDTSEVDIATIHFPETPTDSLLVVPSSSPNISSFLKGNTLSYNLFWKNRKPTTKPLRLQIYIRLNVQ